MTTFLFTSDNLIENIDKLGAWSAYGLASIALQHYFPDEYDEEDGCSTAREGELLDKIDCKSWQDAIVKYQTEIGYDAVDGFNPIAVNAN